MATEHDASETDVGIRPQTPAARRRNPAAARQRTPEERERLRAESRARRKARESGTYSGPPEPTEVQIEVRRLSEDERAQEAPPASSAEQTKPAPPAPQPSTRPAPATPAAKSGVAERSAPEGGGAERGALQAGDPTLLVASPSVETEPAATDASEADGAPPAAADPPAGGRGFLGDGAPPGQLVGLPRLPTDPRERGIVLLALASAVGIVISLVASLSSGNLPGLGSSGMRIEAKPAAIAPGGWARVSGVDAPAGSDLVLESRSGQAAWHPFGEGSSDGDGRFDLRGRVLERPGRVQLRVRAIGGNATAPIPVTVRPLRLASVGDINLQDAPADAWATVGPTLKRADLAFGNLESAVSTRGEPVAKQYNFRADPAALAALRKQSGIDVLNLANNHVGDYGPEATLDTVRGVERNGIKAVGAGRDLRRALRPQVVERLGLRVAFVGFSEIAPLEFAATPDRPGTAWADPQSIADAVHAAKRKADVVVATFHWGIERQTLETVRQRELADIAVRAGAQVVIGAHPHTLQPVRRQGAAIVAYSLGNFVFDGQSPETTTTGILELGLTAEGVTKANWRPATIEGGRPLLERRRPKRIPLRNSLRMAAGYNLF